MWYRGSIISATMKLSNSTFAPVLFALCAGLLSSCGDDADTTPAAAAPKTPQQAAPHPQQTPPALTAEETAPQQACPTAHSYTGGTLPDMQDDDSAEPSDAEPAGSDGSAFTDDDSADFVEEADPLADLLAEPTVTDDMGAAIHLSALHDSHNFTVGSVIHAAENGDTAKLEELLNAGGNLNSVDEVGFTPLMAAAAAGQAATARHLLKRGADINLKNRLQETALMLAAQKGHAELVQILLDAGADKSATDALGQTALQHATHNKHNHIAEILRSEPKAD